MGVRPVSPLKQVAGMPAMVHTRLRFGPQASYSEPNLGSGRDSSMAYRKSAAAR
jgi:hypothetical protein